jgi:hypothetical protein
MAASRGAPDKISGGDFTIFIYQTSRKNIALFDFNVFVVRQDSTRCHPHQSREDAGVRVKQQRFELYAVEFGRLPCQRLDIDKARRELA